MLKSTEQSVNRKNAVPSEIDCERESYTEKAP